MHHAAVGGEPVVVERAQHRVALAALVAVERLSDAVRVSHVLVPRAAQREQLVAHRARVARLQLLRRAREARTVRSECMSVKCFYLQLNDGGTLKTQFMNAL